METRQGMNWSLLAPVLISVAALGLSVYQFYVTSVQEVHKFSWVFFGRGIYLVNGGNRTEVVTEAVMSYAGANGNFENGESAPSVIVKPGDARYMDLPSPRTDPAHDPAIGNNYKTVIATTILDTRSGAKQNKALIFSGAYAQNGVYHDFYAPPPAGLPMPP